MSARNTRHNKAKRRALRQRRHESAPIPSGVWLPRTEKRKLFRFFRNLTVAGVNTECTCDPEGAS